MIIKASIDLTLINKEKIVSKTRRNGTPAKFYDIVIFLNDDGEVDQYGQSGTIKESITLEEKNAGVKAAILGNLKIVAGNPAPRQDAHNESKANGYAPEVKDLADDDLPF